VYEAYLDAHTHSAFTGLTAEIDPVEGGFFSTCNGRNKGFNVKLIKNKRIIQAWTHVDFPTHHYSIVDIEFEKCDCGTKIRFNHIGVPDSCDGWLTEGWQRRYWTPLKEFLSEKVPA
jgi:activator of HSP90 ATPase